MYLLTKYLSLCQSLLIRTRSKSHRAVIDSLLQPVMRSLRKAKSKVIHSFKGERERFVSLVAVLMLPFIFNSYRFFPEVETLYYGDLQVLVWTLSLPISGIFLSIAWFMWSKDSQILSTLGILFFTIHLCELVPFYNDNPFWMEIVSVVLFFGIIRVGLYLLKKKIRENRMFRLNHIEIKYPQRMQGLVTLIEMSLKTAFDGKIDQEIFNYLKHCRNTTQEEIDYLKEKMK